VNFCSFDLEISKVLPDDCNDWDSYRPLGISCAATVLSSKPDVVATWYGDGPHGMVGNVTTPQMSPAGCKRLVEYMLEVREMGFVPLTWNGLSFDFRTLAEESGLWDECIDLALNHVDMMFQIVCLKGFPIGLDRACKGMGLQGKPEGMTGALAPVLWQQGEYEKVLDYVSSDVTEPLALAEAVERRGSLTWQTKRGTYANAIIDRWLTVKECLELPRPDTSWMDNPLTRGHFLEWITKRDAVSHV